MLGTQRGSRPRHLRCCRRRESCRPGRRRLYPGDLVARCGDRLQRLQRRHVRRRKISPTRSRLGSMRSFRSAAHGLSVWHLATSSTTAPTRTSSRSTRSSGPIRGRRRADSSVRLGDFATHRERQGLEIDARARQTQTMVTFGSDVELTPSDVADAWVRRENTSWDHDEQYLGVSLAEQLNSTADILAAGARFRLTPFTSSDRGRGNPARSFRDVAGPRCRQLESGAIGGVRQRRGPHRAGAGRAIAVFRPLNARARGVRRVRRVGRSAIRVCRCHEGVSRRRPRREVLLRSAAAVLPRVRVCVSG